MKTRPGTKFKPSIIQLAFVIILFYLSFINFFVIKTTPEIIFLQFLFLVVVFMFARTKEFLRAWLPFIALFFLYEFFRGLADDLSPFYETTLYLVYNFEALIFGKTLTEILQESFGFNKAVFNFSIFFYSIFFYYSFLISFIIWLYRKSLFKHYVFGFLLLSFIGLAFFFLLPTAPPWMVSDTISLGVERYIFNNSEIVFKFGGFSLWNYILFGNPVAAFPSLHVAWPVFTTLFLIKYFKNRWLFLLLVIPVVISFSVVYTGEHYVLDVIFGWALAFVIIYLEPYIFKKYAS